MSTVSEDARIVLQDAGVILSGPVRFSGREWLSMAGVISGCVLLMATGQEIQTHVGRNTEQNLNNDFWDVPAHYGTAGYAGAVAIAPYGIGQVSGNEDIRVTRRLLIQSPSIVGASAMVIRFVPGRSRPYGNSRPWDFNWFQARDAHQSLP